MGDLELLLREVRACTVCAPYLPNPPKPVLRAGKSARLLIVGQAPGRRVHESGIPWNDASGDKLREWLQLSREQFYDESRVAIIPTGFCYPGKGAHGDLPPRPECAPLWHPRLRAALPEVRLTLLVGSHAQAYYLGKRGKSTMSDTVCDYRTYLPQFFPLPHPSPRNRLWLSRRPWFAAEVLPELQRRVNMALNQ
ncbi:MAG TPA: uracil-DNA glycosylase family protein [Methylophilaceae bacterium]|nr:uracil-DNA glycosylase family protein [Methylophilaceae bacterium]